MMPVTGTLLRWATAAALVFASAALPAAAAETYQVDPVHTYVLFRIKHLDVGYSYGRFVEPRGGFAYDTEGQGLSAIEMQVAAANVDTDVEKRDNHLRSPDFFDAEKHPDITFKSTGVQKTGEGRYEVTGDLTLLGVTRSVTVPAEATGAGDDPWGNYRMGFEAVFTVKRSDFGMDFMMNGLGDEVELTVSVEGIRQ